MIYGAYRYSRKLHIISRDARRLEIGDQYQPALCGSGGRWARFFARIPMANVVCRDCLSFVGEAQAMLPEDTTTVRVYA